LELPLNLLTYWSDCFYCDYLRSDGSVDFSKIRRRIAYEEMDHHGHRTGRWLPAHQSLPPLPYSVGLVWYLWEDIHDSWLRIEIQVHPALVSRDLLESALEQAWLTLNQPSGPGLVIRGGKRRWPSHPLSALLPRAKAKRSERKRRALERWQRGEVDFEGLLEEEWQDPGVQEELQGLIAAYRSHPLQLQQRHRELQKQVYDRVRKWFPDPKPRVKVKGCWRQRLPLPVAASLEERPPGEAEGDAPELGQAE
jgi:hypothetical protein